MNRTAGSQRSAYVGGDVQVPDVVRESVVKGLLSCFAGFQVVRIFELDRTVRSTTYVHSR